MSTLTIVDMAGFPLKTKQAQYLPKNHLNAYQEKYSELNSQGINYLLYVFKDMLYKESQKDRQQQMYANSSSKILKEFNQLVTQGTHKLSFLQFCNEEYCSDPAKASQSTQRYESFIYKHLSQIRLPLMRPQQKVYRPEQVTECQVVSQSQNGKSSRKQLITFESFIRVLSNSLQAKIVANNKVNASVLSKIPVVHEENNDQTQVHDIFPAKEDEPILVNHGDSIA